METVQYRYADYPCVDCKALFMIPIQRGRPTIRCECCREVCDCEGEKGCGQLEQLEYKNIDSGDSPTFTTTPRQGKGYHYNNDTKQRHQRSQYKAVKEVLGIPFNQKLQPPYSFASLCNNQVGINSQYTDLLDKLIVQPFQYIGFDYSEEIICKNKNTYPDSVWVAGDMCSVEGIELINNSQVKVVDYDACKSLKFPEVRKNLAKLFTGLESNILLVINFWVEYKDGSGSSTVHDPCDTLNHFETISGFNKWKIVENLQSFGRTWFRDYKSPIDNNRYRSVLLKNKQSGNQRVHIQNQKS